MNMYFENTNRSFFSSPQQTEKVDFSFNSMADLKFVFYDHSLVEAVKIGDPKVHEFLRLLSLCHTVMPEEKMKGKKYCHS